MDSKCKTGYRYVRSYLKSQPVLDVGCAVGEFLEDFPVGSVGLEIAPEFIEICCKKGLKVLQADLNTALPVEDESFQTVFCSHVMEHVLAPILLLRELCRVCKVNGNVVLGLPLESNLFDWRRRYFSGHPYHIYAFTPRNIRHMMKMTGLTTVGLWYDFPTALRLVEKPLNLISPVVRQLAPSYWIVGQKRTESITDAEKYSNKNLVAIWQAYDKK